MLHERRAALYPVAIIAIQDTVNHADFCAMDVAANYAVIATLARFVGDRVFKVGDEIHRFFHLVF